MSMLTSNIPSQSSRPLPWAHPPLSSFSMRATPSPQVFRFQLCCFSWFLSSLYLISAPSAEPLSIASQHVHTWLLLSLHLFYLARAWSPLNRMTVQPANHALPSALTPAVWGSAYKELGSCHLRLNTRTSWTDWQINNSSRICKSSEETANGCIPVWRGRRENTGIQEEKLSWEPELGEEKPDYNWWGAGGPMQATLRVKNSSRTQSYEDPTILWDLPPGTWAGSHRKY